MMRFLMLCVLLWSTTVSAAEIKKMTPLKTSTPIIGCDTAEQAISLGKAAEESEAQVNALYRQYLAQTNEHGEPVCGVMKPGRVYMFGDPIYTGIFKGMPFAIAPVILLKPDGSAPASVRSGAPPTVYGVLPNTTLISPASLGT